MNPTIGEQSQPQVRSSTAPQREHGGNSFPSNEKTEAEAKVPNAKSAPRQIEVEHKDKRAFCSPILIFFSALGSLFAGMVSISATAGQSMSKFYWHIPLLYGDKTAREEWPEITGFKSGCAAGAKSLMYGFYDGITGIVTLPYKGAKGAGIKGFAIGILHGIGGLIFKPLSGIWALIGHPIFGLHKYITNRKNKKQQDPAMMV